MKFYLMRHCAAGEGEPMDPDRTLDDAGIAQAGVMRKFLKIAGIRPDVIICSDFKRADDTANLMRRGGTPIEVSAKLRPDSDPSKAWRAIAQLADGADRVLVVTHGPLIQPLLASVAFNFVDYKWQWEHGAIAYVNTHESRFRWFVTPKLAAHLVGADPKEVEDPNSAKNQPVTEDERRILAAGCMAVAENLMAGARQAVIAPLRNQMRQAITKRWKKQAVRIGKTLKGMRGDIAGGAGATHVIPLLQAALPQHDDRFQKAHHRIRTAAYQYGATHVISQIGDVAAFGSRVGEAKRPQLPAGVPPTPTPTADKLEQDLDNTTADRMKTALEGVTTFTFPAAWDAIHDLFDQFSDPESGQLSRADTVALDTVSDGYHEGGSAVAQAARDNGAEIEKMWDIGAEGCATICQPNNDEGWIPYDSPHDSGDFEPPGHPNCDCSEQYRTAGDDDEE